MKQHIYEFKGLCGVKARSLKGPIVSSTRAASEGLKKYRIISSAGDFGAINIYILDCGLFRCERMAYMVIKNSADFKFKKDALAWFKKNFPKIRNG